MPVEIVEAYDREDEFPAFVLLYHRVDWRDRGLWQFSLVAKWPSGKTHTTIWPIRTKPGAAYETAKEALRRKAAAIGYRQVKLFHCQRPPTREDIATFERVNRQTLARKEQARKERKHERYHPERTTERRQALGAA